jgi:hypothetical protein
MVTDGDSLGTSNDIKGQCVYECFLCDFKCSKKYSWDRHIMTSKHIQVTASDSEVTQKGQKGQKGQKSIKYCCELCNKEYGSRNGLWKHNKICKVHETPSINETINEIAKKITDKDELIMFLIKENSEFKNIIMEQQTMMMKVLENGTNNVTNTNTNCMNNNKTFNLQFFLNETCKDAMNIMDFVDSIKLQLSDLEKFGDLNYVDGISSIITNNLKALDVTQRPVHCTDKKRETMYIKDENKWEKEDDNKTKLRKAIKRIANKNINLLPQFREKYPEYKNSSSRISDKYDKMVIEVMGGLDGSPSEKEDKIIHNISKCVGINAIKGDVEII